eukprot:1848305-Pleurochrysis_carterae.AAC.1
MKEYQASFVVPCVVDSSRYSAELKAGTPKGLFVAKGFEGRRSASTFVESSTLKHWDGMYARILTNSHAMSSASFVAAAKRCSRSPTCSVM